MIGSGATLLRSADGATAEVHHHGAHVTSWRPAPGDVERLYLSERSDMSAGAAIRGGIPVIFPQFAAEGPLPRHGFARTSMWTPSEVRADSASFELRDSAATREVWPARFRALLTVAIGGSRLEVTLSVENTGDHELSFTAALHTYLRVLDIADARITGLQGASYRDAASGGKLVVDHATSVRAETEIDRVYVNAPRSLTLHEPARRLRIETSNFPDVVVWNPGQPRAALLEDMGPGDERHMLCVEAAAVQRPVKVAADARWSATQTLTASSSDTPDTWSAMSADELGAEALSPRDGLVQQLTQLEAFVARAEADGEELPAEAIEMVTRLREIVHALDGLTSMMSQQEQPPDPERA